MVIYAVKIVIFSSDCYGEDYIESYHSTKDKAETHILEQGLLDKGYEDVYVQEINVR